jgi:hypothetical protein
MSDGGTGATPDHRRAPGTGQLITSTQSAAPWERFSEPAFDENLHRWQPEPMPETYAGAQAEPAEHRSRVDDRVGSHTGGGLSVADLIAKVGAKPLGSPTHRHVSPAAEPAEPALDAPVDLQQTQVIETPAYSLEVLSELPDLEAASYPNGDEPEADEDGDGAEAVSRPKKSRWVRKAKAPADAATDRKPRRRPALLAVR